MAFKLTCVIVRGVKMGTAQPHLEFTDGITSVRPMDQLATTPELQAAMPYRLSFGMWSPKVARRSANPLSLPYASVQEEMTIDIKGATPAECYARLEALNTLLDQAERWYNNELVPIVLVKYQPKGSDLTVPLQDVCIGGGADDASAALVTLPDDFNYGGTVSFLKGIRLRFWRKNGLWLGITEELTTSNVAQPGPVTINWGDYAPVLSPVDLVLGSNQVAGSDTGSLITGYIVNTHDADHILSVLGTAEISGSSVATGDSTNLPTQGTNVARFTVNPTNIGYWDIDALPLNECEYFAAFVKARNNSASIKGYMQVVLHDGSLIGQEQEVNQSTAKVTMLGIFPTRGRALQKLLSTGDFALTFRSAGASITIDIDSLLFVGINRATNIMFVPAVGAVPNNITFKQISATQGLYLLHRWLAEPQGIFAQSNVPNDILKPYEGSVYNYTGASESVKQTAIAIYMTQSSRWNIKLSGSVAKINLDVKAKRYKGYLVPE